MSVSNNLAKAVSTHDIRSVRDCLSASIAFDRNLTRGFLESLRYCLENGVSEAELYEEHDGRNLNRAETKEAFSKLLSELGSNFSRERIEALRNLGRKLWPPAPEEKANDNPLDTCQEQGDGVAFSLLPLIGLAIGGVIVGGLFSGIVLKRALIGAVVGGVVGAAAGAMLGNRKR